MAQKQASNTDTRLQRLLTFYQTVFTDAFFSPACWLFIAIYLLSLIFYLPAGGNIAGLLAYIPYHTFYLLLVLLILPLTAHAPLPVWKVDAAYSRRKLWWQTTFALFCVVLSSAYSFWLFNSFEPQLSFWHQHYHLLATLIPLLTPLIILCLLPLPIMRLLGVPWQELGFARGYRSWLITSTLCIIAIFMLFMIYSAPLPDFFVAIVHYFFIASLPEEVFFRGILLTRLIRLFGTKWGIVLSSLIFGIIHLATNLNGGESIFLVLCEIILSQATAGIILALIFVRTQNLLTGVVFHTLLDAL